MEVTIGNPSGKGGDGQGDKLLSQKFPLKVTIKNLSIRPFLFGAIDCRLPGGSGSEWSGEIQNKDSAKRFLSDVGAIARMSRLEKAVSVSWASPKPASKPAPEKPAGRPANKPAAKPQAGVD